MSGDPYRKALPGEKLRIPAVTWNRVLDLVSPSSDRTAGQEFSYRQANLRLYCQNNTGTGVERFEVLAITGVTPTPSGVTGAASLQFQHSPAVIGVATTADTGGAFVVAVEPILAGNMGLVAIDGVVQVKLNVTNVGDKFASPAAASRQLTTSSSGQASILWKEAGTGPNKWGLVRIGAGAGGGVKAGTFTGAWAIGATATVTFRGTTGPTSTAAVENLTWPLGGCSLGETDCIVGNDGAGWLLLSPDLSSLASYNAANIQLIGHSASGCMRWYDIASCATGATG